MRAVREYLTNEQIRAREVRVIEEEGEQLGVMPLSQALSLARERNVDLVEVAPAAVPPVCRLMDYGRFRYLQAKREREAKQHQHIAVVREVRMRPKIHIHDMELKARMIKKLLEEGDKVKLSVIFRGREQAHPEIGQALLVKVAKTMEEVALVERPLVVEGRNMNVLLSPRPQKQAAKRGDSSAQAEDP